MNKMRHIYDKATAGMMMAVCAMGIGLSACDSDNALQDDAADTAAAVKVNISTRAAGETNSVWSDNDVITLQAYNSGVTTKSQTATCTYAAATSTWSNTTGALYWNSYLTPLDFMGYYPTTATADGLAFAIPTDQSDAAKLHAADYMTTDRKYDVSNTTANGTQVDFTFAHRLVKVVLNLTYANEYDGNLPTLSNAAVFSLGSGVKVTFNTDNATTSTVTATGTATAVKPAATMDGTKVTTYTALVAPGTITGNIIGNTLISLAVNGKVFWAGYKGSITTLESGKAYSFNLKVGLDKLELTSMTTYPGGWGAESAEVKL